MNKDEIKKGLECCSSPRLSSCNNCPYNNNGEFSCSDGEMYKDALNLITEQEKEIEQLKEQIEELRNEKWDAQDDLDCYYDEMPSKIKQAKIDVLNELKWKMDNERYNDDTADIIRDIIYELIKEIEK